MTRDYGWLLRAFSIALGVSYLLALPASPYAASPVIKGLSIALLAALPWVSKPAPGRGLLTAALAASSIGDILLDVDPERLFVAGLCAFLAAHIIYTVLFAGNGSRNPGTRRSSLLAAVVVYAVAVSIWIVPSTGSLKIPVTIYICAITAMTTTALRSQFGWRVSAGALLFLTSDSLLAIAKFKSQIPARDYLVWGTYYAAQYLIATGALEQAVVNYELHAD
ncbi:MAG: lysoplasmalogenase [Acidobacteriia bacterium]|nr:lysoplasmalogenase [Terriglobia bacterium]